MCYVIWFRNWGSIWLCCLNNNIYCLNNTTHIFTIFFLLYIFSQYLNNVIRTTLCHNFFHFLPRGSLSLQSGLWHEKRKLQDSFPSSRICIVSHLFFVRLYFEFLKSNFTSGQGVFFPLLQDLHCFKAPGSAQFHIYVACLTSFMRVGQAEVKKKKLKEEKKR